MKLFEYHLAWRFSSENWEVGIIKAESVEDAEKILKKENPTAITCSVYDTIEDIKDNESYSIYSK